MQKIGFIVLLSVLVALTTSPVHAQEKQETTKKVVYEITVMGLTCQADAAKLDQFMLKRKGILSSSTDFTTKRVKVVVDPFVNISALRNVIVAAGFEMSEENLTQSEQ
ncbi:MAG: heavy-metal-associated domain-containing protein [Bacteroidia bacterium]|nr:heavy-metal-associated domain-containing protein [Bacteroidia bacterium]